MSEQLAKTGRWAIEIHDLDERGVVAFDLNDVLETLGSSASNLDWIVTDYNPVTEDEDVKSLSTQSLVRRERCRDTVFASRAASCVGIAARTRQTLDGQFIGITRRHGRLDHRPHRPPDVSELGR
jgi:hypothetical protein